VLGPVLRDDTITYDDLDGSWRLPSGWTLTHAPGRVTLAHRADDARFAWTPGAESWKRAMFPATSTILHVRRHGRDEPWERGPVPPAPPALALVGVRGCELRALDVLDRVFLDAAHPDPRYAARRADVVIVALDCAEPGGTCWCTSTGGHPWPDDGFDLRLSELGPDDGFDLVVRSGSAVGDELLEALELPAAEPDAIERADRRVTDAATTMPAVLAGADLPALLEAAMEHPRWDDVASRCLSCGSCTMVCPTCFCSSMTDTTDVSGTDVRRIQAWASCFQLDHSWLHGGHVRTTTRSRYRQWLTHKLGTWPEQLGTPGCVGCGRCTDWCPVGIDLQAELVALAGGEG
jgi:ferredoxin